MMGVELASRRRPSVHSTFLNIDISETSGQIAITFYLKHHWVEGKAAIHVDFEPDRIRTLDSMATDSYHMVIIGKML